jgi:Asp-tRNA(Asn)/Glu-tRNA(Gln) amidotransferase C subunit
LNVLDQLSETREDSATISLDRDDALDNAPDSDGVYFQVPPTIKHNKERNND